MGLEPLSRSRSGDVKNKNGRVDKISNKVLAIRDSGRMSLADAQALHGLLNLATGYFAGKFLKYAFFKIFAVIDRENQKAKRLIDWCTEVLTCFGAVKPRTIPISVDLGIHPWILGKWCSWNRGCSSRRVIRQNLGYSRPGRLRLVGISEKVCLQTGPAVCRQQLCPGWRL